MVPVLFRTDEFARLVGFDPQALRNWVAHDVIRPALPGTGRGSTHLFSPQQAYALAAVAVLSGSSRGVTYGYVRRVLAWFESMPDSGPGDPHAEEAGAVWLHGPGRLPLLNPDAAATPWDADEQRQVCSDIEAAWLRIAAAVRDRMTPPDQRTAAPADRLKAKRAQKAKWPTKKSRSDPLPCELGRPAHQRRNRP